MCLKETQFKHTYSLCLLDGAVDSRSTGDIQRASYRFLSVFKPLTEILITLEQKDFRQEKTSRTITSLEQTTGRCRQCYVIRSPIFLHLSVFVVVAAGVLR